MRNTVMKARLFITILALALLFPACAASSRAEGSGDVFPLTEAQNTGETGPDGENVIKSTESVVSAVDFDHELDSYKTIEQADRQAG